MSSVFITATGTDIGKTFVASKMLNEWREQGLNPHAVKPLMSGFGESDLAQSDAGQLLAAMGEKITPENVNRICMRRYEKPVAPNQAAREANQALDYDDILAFVNSRVLLAEGSPIIVEGAGGIMSPVTDNKLHLDLIYDLAMPAILVTANYLGSISHTLSALEVMSNKGIVLERVVVTKPTSEHGEAEALIEELQRWSDVTFEVA
ncbi:dethiobiotin synthase [Hirschia baltica]|uniref:ATP-dependent dethiobiotin synthetase BioD n=1 Tax=Hirschia baltica (strain ATCC 49814 / DSM 5838 / IFAM 1418) TaxID=582402 RepID=C6XNL1_HIRBI|nr:dethiobiotin synthase [Hirschia baltica]ACT58264.1 dethiobiotin synthase [Hirschia baltica ATCC 49814]